MLDARICSEEQLEKMDSHAIKTMYKRPGYVYAHGKLEADLGTDIIYLFLGDQKLCNGLIAYTQDWKPVCFHLYKHPRTLELTGIVTYSCDDEESYRYGKRLVDERPERF